MLGQDAAGMPGAQQVREKRTSVGSLLGWPRNHDSGTAVGWRSTIKKPGYAPSFSTAV